MILSNLNEIKIKLIPEDELKDDEYRNCCINELYFTEVIKECCC